MPRGGRRLALPALVLPVLLLHLQLGRWVEQAVPGFGSAERASGPQRLRADFTVELRPAAPPVPQQAAPPARPRATRTAAVTPPPAPAASQPAPQTAPHPESAAAPVADAPEPASPDPVVASRPTVPGADEAAAQSDPISVPAPSVAGSAAAAAPAASAAETFPGPEWPRATRLSYLLTGYYRGPVDGKAQVEWLREGDRYQVHLEVAIGPSFAPLMSRRMSSDGLITPEGLRPRHYEEETRVVLRDPRRQTVSFGESTLRLATGVELPRPSGVQDTASQFVQLTWLFTTQPQRLRSGEAVELVLALPRRVDPWVYDVLGVETLHTGAGPIEAVHVKPRRLLRPSGELAAELWVAPTLQYLPVRIVIRQDVETHVDLLLDRLPQQDADVPGVPR